MVNGILALATSLHLQVVAEGVETESQLAALRDCHCNVLQGFLLCRPQSAASIQASLDSHLLSLESEEAEEEIPIA
jgi:EAL domain-containing protein (putative c-di-GMP-specific phosphodiesterase class I)